MCVRFLAACFLRRVSTWALTRCIALRRRRPGIGSCLQIRDIIVQSLDSRVLRYNALGSGSSARSQSPPLLTHLSSSHAIYERRERVPLDCLVGGRRLLTSSDSSPLRSHGILVCFICGLYHFEWIVNGQLVYITSNGS
ncbi:hypothetical protein Mapa_008193 [Marchantia paleacea]|nr:hypothetical protein Mapa_008193 [Marchantia paleacea]